MDRARLKDLLEATHQFPGSYTIKIIGDADDSFVDRVVLAARAHLARSEDLRYTVRKTPQGRHIAVTLDLAVATADEVLVVYQALQVVTGLRLLL